MKVEVNVPKKWAYVVLIGLLLGSGVFAVWAAIPYTSTNQPNPGHGGTTVWVDVEGTEMTLQDAITNKKLGSGSTTTTTTGGGGGGLILSNLYEPIVPIGNGDGAYVDMGTHLACFLDQVDGWETDSGRIGCTIEKQASGNWRLYRWRAYCRAYCVDEGGGGGTPATPTGTVEWTYGLRLKFQYSTDRGEAYMTCGTVTGAGSCAVASSAGAAVKCTDGNSVINYLLDTTVSGEWMYWKYKGYCVPQGSTISGKPLPQLYKGAKGCGNIVTAENYCYPLACKDGSGNLKFLDCDTAACTGSASPPIQQCKDLPQI